MKDKLGGTWQEAVMAYFNALNLGLAVFEAEIRTQEFRCDAYYTAILDVTVKLSLFFYNRAPRLEDVLGSGGIVP
jgi:hypothetical protein